jgi:hypothetical protein
MELYYLWSWKSSVSAVLSIFTVRSFINGSELTVINSFIHQNSCLDFPTAIVIFLNHCYFPAEISAQKISAENIDPSQIDNSSSSERQQIRSDRAIKLVGMNIDLKLDSSVWFGIYIYIDRYRGGLNATFCTDTSVYHVKISKFKLKMTDLNHSTYSSYQILVENQILYFLFFFAIFLGQEKVVWFKNFGSSNSDDFFPT